MSKNTVLTIFTFIFFTVTFTNQSVQAEDADPLKMVEIARTIDDMSVKELDIYISALLKLKKPEPIDEGSLKLALEKVYFTDNGIDILSVLLEDENRYESDSLQAMSKRINESVYSDDLKEQAITNIKKILEDNENSQKEYEEKQRKDNYKLKVFGILISGILIIIGFGLALICFPGIFSKITKLRLFKKKK